MTTRALVLAGGGVTGIGWELGVMLGLRDAEVDVLGWDLVVGTSAGAVVGAALGQAGDLDALGLAFGTMDGARLRQLLARRDLSLANAIDDLWFGPQASVDGPDQATRAAIGRLAASVHDPELADVYLAAIERILPSADWPAPLVVTVTAVADGAPWSLTAASGVPLALAVAASCAVPGVFPPVEIDGGQYMDGGVRSASNAELGAGHDHVVVVAPNRPDGRWVELLDHETTALEADGTKVVEILLDEPSLAAFGTDTMDQSRVAPAMLAGRAVGRRAGDRLTKEVASRTT